MEKKKKCLYIVFRLTRRSRVGGKKYVFSHPIARATSYCSLPDTFWLRTFKNAFKVGTINFASLPFTVKTAKGLKPCRANVKGVNNPPEPPNSQQTTHRRDQGEGGQNASEAIDYLYLSPFKQSKKMAALMLPLPSEAANEEKINEHVYRPTPSHEPLKIANYYRIFGFTHH